MVDQGYDAEETRTDLSTLAFDVVPFDEELVLRHAGMLRTATRSAARKR